MKKWIFPAIILLFSAWLAYGGKVKLPPDVPVKFGESVGVNGLYNGKGSFRIGIEELDKNGKVLARTLKTYYGRNLPDNRTFVAVIQNPKTVKARALYIAGKNSSIELKRIALTPLDKEMTALYSVKANRKLWQERTKGVNLIAGKRLSFSPSTKSYPLTYKGGTDPTDLTDGKFGRDDDQIWFDSRAVAWQDLNKNLSIIADLGAIKKVEKAVIRIAGGKIDSRTGASHFPPILEAWVSKDGKDYFLARRLKLVGPAEKNDSNWKTLYYLPQTSDGTWPSYVYPFELSIEAEARFVIIRSPEQYYMAADEMAIIRAEKKTPHFNGAYKGEAVPLFHKKAILSHHYPIFHVAKDVYLPTLLKMDDKRPDKTKPLSYELDLPSSILFYQDPAPPWPGFTRIPEGIKKEKKRTIYRFRIKPPNWKNYARYLHYGIGPFYCKAGNTAIPAKERYVKLRTLENGKLLYSKKIPLEVLELPKVPGLKNLSIGPAFFFERYLVKWPEFHKSMRAIGFNTLRFDYLSPDSEKQFRKFYKEGVKANFRFRGQMSCTICVRLYAAKEKANVNELRCQFPGSDKFRPNDMCPSYRGKYYQKVLSILRENSAKYPMEFISFDEEAWCYARSGDTFTKCTRCDALRKKKGMSWKEFIPWVQADFISGFYKAVKHGKNPPQVGYYNVHPGHLIGSSKVGPTPFNGFPYLFPAYCEELQPSPYTPDTARIHKSARDAWNTAKDPKKVHLWLSAGMGAYVSSPYGRHTFYQILETFMNGASGIQYYYFQSFVSPLDYAYVAEALKLVAPFEELLMKGEFLTTFRGSNKNLLYTARRWKNKTLLLVGNYGAGRVAETVLKVTGKVTDLETGKGFTAKGSFSCKVPADGIRFFLVEK